MNEILAVFKQNLNFFISRVLELKRKFHEERNINNSTSGDETSEHISTTSEDGKKYNVDYNH